MEKKLYPLKFISIASRRPWGGSALVKKLGKHFVECDEEGNETVLGEDVLIGESWELADMGIEDSVIENGWLAGNTISEVMETYLERIVGEKVYNHYGRQRYDQLGKAEIWYVMDAQPGAVVYAGFNREVSAQEFYDRCKNGTVGEIMNEIHPKAGDSIYVTPGTVHAADGGLLIAEIQESSDMTFRLYDWGREFNPATARKLHLEEAIDLIDYNAFNPELYKKGPLWGEEDHKHTVETLVESPQFNVAKLNLTDPLHIYTEKFESFIIYICTEGAASVQVPSVNEKGEACMDTYEISKGETILIPAELPDFYLVPRDRETVLLEAVTRPVEELDEYIDPTTEAFLENEDYEGAEDEGEDDEIDDTPAGASPLNFFS